MRHSLAALGLMVGLGMGGCAHLSEVDTHELCEITRAEAEDATPSIVLAAFSRDELLFLDASGTADVSDARPATTDTVYMFFSISKVFTATAVMQLVDDGKIDLDRPLREYLPELALQNPFDTPLTVRHLLNHSSGLPNPAPWAWAHLEEEPRPRLAQFLDSILAEHPELEHEPGTRDDYNNLGYLILGLLVERTADQPYEDYVRARILEPLGMQRTDFVYRPAMKADAARGTVERNSLYHRLFRRVARPELFGTPTEDYATSRLYLVDGAPYGGLVGTAEDLSRFARMHLGGGTLDGQRVLSPEAVAAMQAPQRLNNGKLLDHALGWHSDTIDGERYFNHMGKGGGFRPAVRIYPGLGYGIVVLTNRTKYDPKPITRRVPITGTARPQCTAGS